MLQLEEWGWSWTDWLGPEPNAALVHGIRNSCISTIRLAPGHYRTNLTLTTTHCGLTLEGGEAGGVVLLGAHVVRGATGVTLRRLSLVTTSPTAPALLVEDANGVEVDSCTIEGGVEVRGGTDHRVHHSQVSNPRGGHCVWIAACGDLTQVPWQACNTSVDNNVITDCFNTTGGPYAPGSAGVLLGCTNGVSVEHNHISRIYSWGVRINNNEYCPSILNSVRLNRIEQWGVGPSTAWSNGGDIPGGGGSGDAVAGPDATLVVKPHSQEYGEGACMYVYGHWFSPGNLFEYNHCHSGPICMYADDASSGQTFRGNICQNVTGTVMKINGGHNNLVEGNMFLESNQPNGLTGRGMGWKCPLDMSVTKSVYACSNVFHNNGDYPNGAWGNVLRAANFDQPPWITLWPWYKGWCNYTSYLGQDCDPAKKGYDCFMMPTGNRIAATAIVMPMSGHGHDPVRWLPCTVRSVFGRPCGTFEDRMRLDPCLSRDCRPACVPCDPTACLSVVRVLSPLFPCVASQHGRPRNSGQLLPGLCMLCRFQYERHFGKLQ
jgi:hypothetical protein